MTRYERIYECGKPLRYVYFPETAIVSLLTVTKTGTQIEVASVGCEGMVGLPIFFGGKKSSRRALCQLPGTAYRMNAAALRKATRHGGPVSDGCERFTEALLTFFSQLATCNRLHSVKQRCCCWLLLTHDRVDGDEFYVTHEFLSKMLGVRRSGVTVVAGALQRAGLIRYRRGNLAIVDRKGLEKAACECYGVVRREFDRLLA